MIINTRVRLPEEQAITALKKLLGKMELEVMEIMWQVGEATVQEILNNLSFGHLSRLLTLSKGIIYRSYQERR